MSVLARKQTCHNSRTGWLADDGGAIYTELEKGERLGGLESDVLASNQRCWLVCSVGIGLFSDCVWPTMHGYGNTIHAVKRCMYVNPH